MKQHTPGPWEYRPIKNRKEIGNIAPEIFAGKLVVARTYDPHRLSEAQANARLIAKAPEQEAVITELFDALGALADAVADGSDFKRLTAAMVKAGTVLAKATQ